MLSASITITWWSMCFSGRRHLYHMNINEILANRAIEIVGANAATIRSSARTTM